MSDMDALNALNSGAKEAIITGLELTLPESPVGTILGGLISWLWPDSVDGTSNQEWHLIKEEIEKIVKKKIDKQTWKDVEGYLSGLNSVLNDYVTSTKDGLSKEHIYARWSEADSDFDLFEPSFQLKGQEALLLPLFAQFANLRLMLLRDGVLNADSLGMNSNEKKATEQKLQGKISAYLAYVPMALDSGFPAGTYDTTPNLAPTGTLRVNVISDWNKYLRHMILNVMDYAFYWPYYDPETYQSTSSAPVKLPQPSREIYSEPYGTAFSSWIGTGMPATAPITEVTAWYGDYLNGLQITTNEGTGPLMGYTSGTSSNDSKVSGTISGNEYLKSASGSFGDVVNTLVLKTKDSSTKAETVLLSAGNVSAQQYDEHYHQHELTNIRLFGTTPYSQAVIFGFQLRKAVKHE